jgi:hypothetical protein
MPPPPQVVGNWHSPHSTTPSQPSETVPQDASTWAQVFGEHVSSPQRFGPSPPQDWSEGHSPHASVSPQPSEMVPHSARTSPHVTGVQSLSDVASPPESPASPPESPASWAGGKACSPPPLEQPQANQPSAATSPRFIFAKRPRRWARRIVRIVSEPATASSRILQGKLGTTRSQGDPF